MQTTWPLCHIQIESTFLASIQVHDSKDAYSLPSATRQQDSLYKYGNTVIVCRRYSLNTLLYVVQGI